MNIETACNNLKVIGSADAYTVYALGNDIFLNNSYFRATKLTPDTVNTISLSYETMYKEIHKLKEDSKERNSLINQIYSSMVGLYALNKYNQLLSIVSYVNYHLEHVSDDVDIDSSSSSSDDEDLDLPNLIEISRESIDIQTQTQTVNLTDSYVNTEELETIDVETNTEEEPEEETIWDTVCNYCSYYWNQIVSWWNYVWTDPTTKRN